MTWGTSMQPVKISDALSPVKRFSSSRALIADTPFLRSETWRPHADCSPERWNVAKPRELSTGRVAAYPVCSMSCCLPRTTRSERSANNQIEADRGRRLLSGWIPTEEQDRICRP